MKKFLFLSLLIILTSCNTGPVVDTPDRWDEQEDLDEQIEEDENKPKGELPDPVYLPPEDRDVVNLSVGESYELEGVTITLESFEITEGEVYEEVLFLIFQIDNNSTEEFDFLYDVKTTLYMNDHEFSSSHAAPKDDLLDILRNERDETEVGETMHYARSFHNDDKIDFGVYQLEVTTKQSSDVTLLFEFEVGFDE
jgi:hypothetical protein